MSTPAQQLRVGRLTKAHGLKGALKLELFTDDPDKRFTPGAIFTLQVPTSSPWHGKTLTLTELRWYNGQPAVISDVQKQPGADSTRLTKQVELAMADLAERGAEMPIAGRTHGQHAVPATFGFKNFRSGAAVVAGGDGSVGDLEVRIATSLAVLSLHQVEPGVLILQDQIMETQ